jgi:anti-sigma28 factor (negative regulator of flagellin synthesis)
MMDNRSEFIDAAEDLIRANLRRELCKKVKALPEMREQVVSALRLAVASGTYRVRDKDIADAMCREMKGDR